MLERDHYFTLILNYYGSYEHWKKWKYDQRDKSDDSLKEFQQSEIDKYEWRLMDTLKEAFKYYGEGR